MSSASPFPPASVHVVTVTYGDRWRLLEQTIEAALHEGAGHVTVVDNGAADNTAAQLQRRFDERVSLIRLERNLGSAGGFHAGMREAMRHPHALLCLLDDDNVFTPGALSRMLATHAEGLRTTAADALAVLALRDEHFVAESLSSSDFSGHADAYLGFRILDLPAKILNHLHPARRRAAAVPAMPAELRWAPWGGLLFHRQVPERIGLPRADYVLYNDDIEWSMRLVAAGGRIVLDSRARIEDVDNSGHSAAIYPNVFVSLLCGSSDFRTYYEFRNRCNLEQQQGHYGLMNRLNRAMFWSLLAGCALAWGRLGRLRLLRAAMHDGEGGRMGLSEHHPLPNHRGGAA
ncbi:glycosyltransferase [Uliginosibacterium paludis]|uniref:Glycosyltransferase n=1 Tax=Uliginosibacterium paludis TaxID=1615952 RepID=A0ABV2CNP0_9RHOO